MKHTSRDTLQPPHPATDAACLEPRAQDDGVSFTVVEQNQAFCCFVTREALEFLDGALHVNLRPLGVYELHQKRIDSIAQQLIRQGVRPPALVVTLACLHADAKPS